MDAATKQKLETLGKLVANTPMSKIKLKYKGEIRYVYAKLEYYSYSGSIKDRMAFHILKDAYEKGTIKQGYEISEATSGNTGIAFSAQGRFLGHKVKIFMPDWMSVERINLIKSLGAEIVPVRKNVEKPEEGGFLGSIKFSKEYAQKGNVFEPLQFENDANRLAHYTTTGPEIWEQMAKFGVRPDAVVAGVGTGGTIMGAGGYLKSKNPECKLYPMEPSNSPTITTGGKKIGSHRIQGISDEFIPAILKLDQLDEVVSVDDGDSIIAAQMLAEKFGMGVGISSGANLISAIKVQNEYGHKDVATLFSDDSKKYLSTDYSKAEPVKPGFLSTDIELISFEVVK